MPRVLIVLFLVVVVLGLFGAAVVATRDGDVLVDVAPDDADVDLPPGPVQPEDVAEVRFGMVLRGYRMREVDAVLARLAGELAARDARVAELEQALVEIVEPELEKVEAQLSTAAVSAPDEVPAPVVEAPLPPDPEPADDFGFPEVAAAEAAPEGAVEATDWEPPAAAAWSASPELPPDPVDLWTAPAPEEEPAPADAFVGDASVDATSLDEVPAEEAPAEPAVVETPWVGEAVVEPASAAETVAEPGAAEDAVVEPEPPLGDPGEGVAQEPASSGEDLTRPAD